MVVSDVPCAAAGVFTQNRFPAAPVLYDRQALQANPAAMRAVVINAGNANACTGEQGVADAQRMAALAEAALGLPAGSALVMSTGVIGAAAADGQGRSRDPRRGRAGSVGDRPEQRGTGCWPRRPS